MPVGIRVQGLTKRFEGRAVLRSVDLNFAAGRLHGLIGSEGAGKTTLLRLMMGLLRPSEGRFVYERDGAVVPFEEIRPAIASMPGRQNLYADLTIDEHLAFFQRLYGLAEQEYRELRTRLLGITRLEPFADRRAGQLSGGMYKKLGLMCALLTRPKVLLLDEPTNGVDPISRREFWELLYGLSEQRITIIISTAYMDEAERCHDVHLLDAGRVMAEGEPRRLLAEAQVSGFDAFYLKQAAGRGAAAREGR